MRLKSGFLSIVLFGSFVATTQAADLPVKSRPLIAPKFTWTGFYIGAHAGYDSFNSKLGNAGTGSSGVPDPIGAGGQLAAGGAQAVTGDIKAGSHGFVGGGQAGYNWQFAPNWVTGIEADLSSGSSVGPDTKVGIVSIVSATITSAQKVEWLGTLRGRLGFSPVERFLAYGTAGIAYGESRGSTTTSVANSALGVLLPFASSATASVSETKVGWAAGAGFEWAFFRMWSVKAEWVHWDLGRLTYASTQIISVAAFPATGILTTTSTAHFEGDIVRAGVNYHF